MDARVIQPGTLCDELSNVFPIIGSSVGKAILDSMLALVSHARTSDAKGHLRPFLQVQLQVWMRELRRVMGKVDKEQADLILESDLNQAKADRREHYLPVVNCRDCGATGWAGLLDERSQLVVKDMKVFYNQFFAFDKRIRMVFPRRENEENTQLHQKYSGQRRKATSSARLLYSPMDSCITRISLMLIPINGLQSGLHVDIPCGRSLGKMFRSVYKHQNHLWSLIR